MSTDQRTRVLFLVTTPLSKSLDWVLCQIDSATRVGTGPTEEVDWHDTSSPVSIPTIKPDLSFTKHLALGVMDREDWDDPSLTNLQRLSRAYFWEHRGPSQEALQGGNWKEEDICTIEAVQFLGCTEKSNETITKQYCSVLLNGWEYLPVWWNCQSFATRLAYLVVGLEIYRDRVATLARQLHTQIVNWAISSRNKTAGEVFVSAWFAGVGSWTGAALSAVVFPPAGAVFVAGLVASWCVGMGTGVTSSIYNIIDDQRRKTFRANMERLEKEFPVLKQLHRYLYG